MITDTLSCARAHEAWLTPPEYPDSKIQVEGCFEFASFAELGGELNTGNLEDITIIDAGFDPETSIMRVWVSAWMDCEPDGEYDKSGFGDLQSVEVVDTEGVDFGPDPDEEWDNRGLYNED